MHPKRTAALPWHTLPTMNPTEQRLFTPGSGATPPALTGREPEQAVLNRCPPGQLPPVTWSAGIPSLMADVLDHAKPPAPARAHP